MLPLRRVLGALLVVGFGASATFACLGDDPDSVPATDAGGDGAPAGEGAMTLELAPAAFEGLPGTGQKLHVVVRADAALAGPIALTAAAPARDGGASPLTIATPRVELSGDLPEGDVTVNIDAASLHGRFPVTVVATAIAQDGRALRGEATTELRVVGRPGTADTGFGGAEGFRDLCPFPAEVPCSPGDVWAYPDGRLLVAGSASVPDEGPTRFFAARFLPDGALDPSFGEGGIASHRGSSSGTYTSPEIAALPDGSFVLAFTGGSYLSFARLLADGRLDTTWGDDGGVATPILTRGSASGNVIPTESGFALVGAVMLPNSTRAGAVEAHLASGAVDTAFGDGGTTSFQIGESTQANAATITSGGALIVAGEDSQGGEGRAFVLSLTKRGDFDDSFAPGPIVPCGDARTCFLDDGPGAYGVRSHRGGYVVLGLAGAAGPLRVIHLDARGRRDQFLRFDVDAGTDPAYPAAIVAQPDDKFLVANGYSLLESFFIARFDGDGRLDPTFGEGGLAQPLPGVVRRMVLTEGGRQLFVLGFDAEASRRLRLARYWLR